MRLRFAALAIVAVTSGCAVTPDTRPLTAVEQDRAWKCDQLIGVSRLSCIQQTAGRQGSPYAPGGTRVRVEG